MGAPESQAKRESIKAANLLLSLSQSYKINKKRSNNRRKNNNGMFECKTCHREFASFQALGGHCTSHLRSKVRFNGIELDVGGKYKETTTMSHICGICGKEFLMGQALGGHMRLHRASPITSVLEQNLNGKEIDMNVLPTMTDEKSGFHTDGDGDGDVINDGFQGRLLNLFV